MMKTIGLLGGTSWVSTIEYYRLLNSLVHKKLKKSHSAQIVLRSIDYENIKQYDYRDWHKIEGIMLSEIQKLSSCGVDCILICNNSLHKVYDNIVEHMKGSLPILHILDGVIEQAERRGIKKLLLLGTKFLLEDGFYKSRLENEGFEIIIPKRILRDKIQTIIVNELSKGNIEESSEKWIQELIDEHDSAEGVVVACTELPLIINAKNYKIPILNTLELQCEKAVKFALNI